MSYIMLILYGILAGVVASYFRPNVTLLVAMICGIIGSTLTLLLLLITGFDGGIVVSILLTCIVIWVYEKKL